MTRLPLIAALAGLTILPGCIQREEILQGERLDPRAVLSPDGPAAEGGITTANVALSLPPVRGNSDWPQRAGNALHASGNEAIGAGTARVFAVDIGAASDRRHRITADPIVAAGLVFTMDSRATVTGTTTGYGELVALDARTGGIAWRQKVDAPIGGAPTVANGVVYVVGRDAGGWAVRANDGKVLWRIFGNDAMAGVMGVTAPAVSGSTVIFPMATGQVMAVDAANGTQIWSGDVAGARVGRSIALFRDMTGDPVIVGDTVYAGTSSGRTAAFDLATGAMKWSAREGASSPVLAVGNSVFLVNDQAQLIRLDAATGTRVWAQKLPYFTAQKVRKQSKVWNHYGPVLAGNRLYIASSDGYLRVFDPNSGTLIGTAEIPGGAATAPAIAGQTLYVVSHDGQLMAFR